MPRKTAHLSAICLDPCPSLEQFHPDPAPLQGGGGAAGRVLLVDADAWGLKGAGLASEIPLKAAQLFGRQVAACAVPQILALALALALAQPSSAIIAPPSRPHLSSKNCHI